jgi:UDP-2-acetamido-3-amino-2,3-dideoxy-glucuronate N-acetyltransferase
MHEPTQSAIPAPLVRPSVAGRLMDISITADIDPTAEIGPGTMVWHLSQIREYATVGPNCILGRGSYVGPGVILGKNCKVQNFALIYEPALLEDGVFVGPAAVLTNDRYPRAITIDGVRKSAEDWVLVGVTIRTGASIGARAVCVAPITIGRWATIAAGSVVTKDVPDFALMVGTPAKRVGWVGRSGVPLEQTDPAHFTCPATGERYRELEGKLSLL